MRNSTLIFTSLVAASSLTIAWNAGQQTLNNELVLLPQTSGTTTATPIEQDPGTGEVPAESPATGETTTPTEEQSPAPTAQETQAPTTDQASAPTQTQAPAQTAAPTAPQETQPPAPVTTTVNSDVITYKYGVVQISLTQTDGVITDIQMLQGDATNGRAEAYVTLISATIQQQSINYGNISGATFTVDAFKKAVTSALSKF